jgi:hypothetical protein
MTMPKGEQKCEQGSRWDMLHKSEPIEFHREWESKCHATNNHVFLLNSTLTRVIKSRNYFSIKLQSNLDEGSTPNIIELFRRAFNVGAFEEHLILLNLLVDVVSNIISIHKNGGKGKAKHANIIKLFEVLLNFESSSTHNFISKKLERPALNTIKFNFYKEGFVCSMGIHESTFCYMCLVLKKCKEKLGLLVLIPFECGKDETKCVEFVTWNRRLDTIDGFCEFHI